MIDQISLEKQLYSIAEDAVRRAGKYLMTGFGNNPVLTGEPDSSSSRSSISSCYDIHSNEILIKTLVEGFFQKCNDDTLLIISEEIGSPQLARRSGQWELTPFEGILDNWDGYTWVIDPLCGSIPYARGVADFIISVSLMQGQQLKIGVVYEPVRDELFYALKNGGAYLNRKPIHPSTISSLKEAYVSIEHKVFRTAPLNDCRELAGRIQRIRVAGTCGLEFCYVACGRLDALIKLNQPLYDYAGGLLILSEALGDQLGFTRLDGVTPISPKLGTAKDLSLIATNGYLLQELSGVTKNWL